MAYIFNFPEDQYHQYETTEQCIKHLSGEVVELAASDVTSIDNAVMECMDVIHVAETLLRRYQSIFAVNIDAYKDKVIQKNMLRGYY